MDGRQSGRQARAPARGVTAKSGGPTPGPPTHMTKEIISRAEAKSAGLKRFFTGLLCANGHISERQVSSGNCLACSAERKRTSRQKEPERHKTVLKIWIEKNKSRINELRAQRRRESPDSHRNGSLAWYYKNRDSVLQKKDAKRKANREKYNKRQRDRNAADPTVNRYYAKLRNAAIKRSVPPWFSELDELVWREATRLTQLRFEATGIKWDADHMIPIKAKTAHGLHVWNNCQVIPSSLNSAKTNKLVMTERNEWLIYI